MIKRILIIGIAAFLISCNSGNKSPEMATAGGPVQKMDHNASVSIEKKEVKIESDEGSLTIAEILENRKKYEGKTVTVKGEITKFNPAILNTNWVHIQDGTEYNGTFDLTLTTGDMVSVGSVATFTGKIVLDKDFGYGYVYNTLMEESKLVK